MMKTTVVPEDFLSHHASWRAALERCIETAPEATHDRDDKAYWRHELRAFDRAFAELSSRRVVVENLLQSPVAGMSGLTVEGALAADWAAVHGSLIQARDHLQKDGVRHTWLDGGIAVAESRSKKPVPDAYLGRAFTETNESAGAQKAELFDELSVRARALGYGNLLSAISSLEHAMTQKASTIKALPPEFTALVSAVLNPQPSLEVDDDESPHQEQPQG